MKHLIGGLVTALSLAVATAPAANADEYLTLATLGPGSSPYMVMSTFARIVEDDLPDVKIQVNATGAATQHAMQAASGQLDFFMWSASVHDAMIKGDAMWSKVPQAPELSKNLRAVFAYPLGLYHIVTYADSGIDSLEDLAGKRVFLGPPGGGATTIMQRVVEGATGLKAGEDFEQVNLGWDAATQAFQDGRIDVYINSTNAPSPVIQQLAISRKIKFLGLTEEQMAKEPLQAILNRPGGVLGEIPNGLYGDNQVNSEPVTTLGSIVGIGTSKADSEETIYRVTKAFWDNLPAMQENAAWLRNIDLDNAFQDLNLPLHPGAIRYYEEIGMEIPDELRPAE
ncbi:TAXI family TRAP transporter solute-binding subunit [Paracoccus tegillarcae]|uniref:C4-dicarboxylate ABC transporter substrate-binding protein n=1 Tax=Paracoccus tegillarcae TaxID=1529068 RepID=A0A2K9EL77_9RHOB|nr:TAXI family TRAP transporter solute-binding subunit [Paracoccus tegillarcae]AUH35199.1 C4-dicarboxylate ABC transporter substrate-binding protein [Paracoccus tegillarcae]